MLGALRSRLPPQWPPLWAAEACGGRRAFALKARHRGCVYVPRKTAKMTLVKAKSGRRLDPTLLLPPFASAGELRVLFRLDYKNTFRTLGVQQAQSKYMWRDADGREFETANKRLVLVPFETAMPVANALGYKPKLVDVEPDWPPGSMPRGATMPVPVVAVLGHINHGKTTLLDALCGTQIAPKEPGGITQEVRAMTGKVTCEEFFGVDEPPAPCPRGALNPYVTFLDTPGHEAFEVQRGRTMATADLAIVVVSLERGAELQTEEVLLHASRWGVPVIFALNKVDLPDCHIELTRAELRRQCQRLQEQGLTDVDWTAEAEAAVPISALHGLHLQDLMRAVRKKLATLPALPATTVEPPTCTPGEALRWREVPRRTDFLVNVDAPPSAVALVVEVERAAANAETTLTLIVRSGRLMVGQYFVTGTAFGRISRLGVALGGGAAEWADCETAAVGAAVHMAGLRTKKIGGDCAPDDLLYVFPKERAWRLSEHRRRIEALVAVQTRGPELVVPWEHSARDLAARTQTAFDRANHEQPERHANSAYERRWLEPAVQELGGEEKRPRTFSSASRRDFEAPLPDSSSLRDGSEAPSAGSRGRRRKPAEEEAPQEASRFQVLTPAKEDAAPEEEQAPSAGRKSRRARRAVATEPPAPEEERAEEDGQAERPKGARTKATGAWSEGKDPGRDFVYYADRQSWTEEADIDSSRVRSRWQWKDEMRWEEMDRRQRLQEAEAKLAEDVRAEVFGPRRTRPKEPEEEEDLDSEHEPRPLPRRNMPVIPLILKTKSVGQFDLLMDELEGLEESFAVRVVIVHGGIGQVIPKDVVHAEVEKFHGFCPIYAFQVGCTPEAAGQAQAERIDVRRFDVFTELVGDVAQRCERLHAKKELEMRKQRLGHFPGSESGL